MKNILSSDYPDISKILPSSIGYAHNDSVYNKPLFDSLLLGYHLIEVDIHLINNELIVSHHRPFFPNYNNTLTKLYLEPLYFYFQKHNNQIFPKSKAPLYLFLDIKTNAEATYQCLKNKIEPFQNMFSQWDYNLTANEITNAVTIVLSGNRPIQKVLSEKSRHVTIDGRLADLNSNYSPALMPFVSDKYSKIFGRSFYSKTPSKKNLNQLSTFAKIIKDQGKQFRLWKIPENEHIWDLLLQHNLDIISTDKLKKLNLFLEKNFKRS